MSNKRNTILSILLLCVSGISLAQLPSMDVQVKSGVAILEEMSDVNNNIYNYSAPVIHGELNLSISQHFAIGAFLSKGISGQTKFHADDPGNSSYKSSHQTYGVKLRVSTGRQPRFRPFAELSFGKFEMYMEKDFYRQSTSSTFFGWSMGLMIRLNGKFYLTLPQVSVRTRSNPFFFEESGDFLLSPYPSLIELTGGLSYNFGKKK